MSGGTTFVLGIEIPSSSPVFLGIVGIHILFGLACVVAGAGAMLSKKGRSWHRTFGKIYYWCLVTVFVSQSVLAITRWAEDYQLFVLGALSFGATMLGRWAAERRWLRFHISGMVLSYILMLTAFYVDNGKNLPLWRDLPSFAYWILPSAVGLPIMIWALLRHRLVRMQTFRQLRV